MSYDRMRRALTEAIELVEYLRPEYFDDEEHERSFYETLNRLKTVLERSGDNGRI